MPKLSTKRTGKRPADFTEQSKVPDATIRVGPYVAVIERAAFERWESDIAATVGFSREAIVGEVKRRLGLD